MVDGRLTDPFAAYNVKYRASSKKQRADETREQFVNRIWKTFPAVIMELRANIDAAALAYNVETKMLKAFVAQNKKCTASFTKARTVEAAVKSDEEAKSRRSNAEDAPKKDSRLMRKHWPVDADQKEEDAHDAMLVSIVQNEGNLIEVSKCLSLDTTYILEMMTAYDDLVEAKELGMEIAVMQSEAKLAEQAKGGNLTAIKLILTNKAQDEWSDRQTVNVKHSGFEPPAETSGGLSLIETVKGKKNA